GWPWQVHVEGSALHHGDHPLVQLCRKVYPLEGVARQWDESMRSCRLQSCLSHSIHGFFSVSSRAILSFNNTATL
ncbi:hypothetical protein MUK42_12329, partial [Musa troglodytarum]